MAFKGTWHQADGPTNNGGSARAAGDRRYPSSNDSYNNYSHPGPNPIGLAPMNYSTNPNSMYSGTTMMSGSGTNYSSGGKSSAYTGTVSNLYRDYGVIDNEISFKMNAVIGPMPRVGDRVICQMKQADAFGPQTPYKYYGFDVRIASNAPDPRRAPPRPSTGNSQGMTRNSDSYANRSQSSSMKRGVAPSNSSTNNNHRDRSRPSKPTAPPAKRNSRPTTPKYSCTLPKGTLDCSELNVIELRSRYSRLHIPSDFYHASYKWHQTIPLDHPLKFLTPCSFHIFNKNVPRLMTKHTSVLDPEDADYRWNVRVLLMSNPDLQTLIQRSCMISSEKKSSTNPDDYEHPSKLIKFLVAVRNQNEYFPLGGPWSPSLDGADPERDPQVLIRTAIRCVHAQTGIDLSECLQWCRYLELRYHRPEEIHKGRLIESRVENVVVFLPDVASSSMPSTLQWEEIVHVYRQACQEELAEELNENSNATTQNDEISSNEETGQTQPTHYSQLQLDHLKLDQLKNELKARGQSIHGIKLDLKRRLAKILHQEKVEEEKLEDSSNFVEEKDHSSSDIDKLRKEIEMKYQLPSHRAILVHPTDARGDRFDCRIVSLHYLLNYANKDTIREKCFELYLFSESFFEMLMRDSIYQIYRSLYSCLEVTETKTTENEEENPPAVAAAPPTTLELSVHDDELETDENGKKRKRSPSKDDETNQKKKTRLRTVLPELLFAFTFFDRNRSGYLVEKDLEELLLCGGLALTKNEVNKLVSRIVEDDKIRYHQLTDKLLPVDEGESETFPIETEIDPQAPKGNLHLLPSTSSIDETQQTNFSLDHQRAMKQLEVSHRIQTGLELKIDKLKKEIHQLTDDLHTAQKSSRTATEQLNETKKRLRETQQDLKELDEKYKRYSDALYRVRSESRSTFDHLTRVLGIKEKSSSQSISSKSEEEMKKVPTTNEIEQNNETPMKSEETNPTEMIVNDQSL